MPSHTLVKFCSTASELNATVNPTTGETRYVITSAGMLAYEKDGQ